MHLKTNSRIIIVPCIELKNANIFKPFGLECLYRIVSSASWQQTARVLVHVKEDWTKNAAPWNVIFHCKSLEDRVINWLVDLWDGADLGELPLLWKILFLHRFIDYITHNLSDPVEQPLWRLRNARCLRRKLLWCRRSLGVVAGYQSGHVCFRFLDESLDAVLFFENTGVSSYHLWIRAIRVKYSVDIILYFSWKRLLACRR